jgi:hypothetical protein
MQPLDELSGDANKDETHSSPSALPVKLSSVAALPAVLVDEWILTGSARPALSEEEHGGESKNHIQARPLIRQSIPACH